MEPTWSDMRLYMLGKPGHLTDGIGYFGSPELLDFLVLERFRNVPGLGTFSWSSELRCFTLEKKEMFR